MTLNSAQILDQLRQENTRLLALIEQRECTIQNLQHQRHLFRTARFGRKSEKGVVPEQMALLFDEAALVVELEQDAATPETQTITYTHAKKNTGRKPLPQAGGILLSLIETCKRHQINVFSWLKYTLTHIQQAHTLKQLETLLPYNIDTQCLDNMRSLPNLILPA